MISVGVGAVVSAVVAVVIAVWGYLPARRAAAGQTGPESRWGIRTQATVKSAAAWQRGHAAALIYLKALPWIAGIGLVIGIGGWLFIGVGAALAAFIVAVACEVFALMFGFAFAVVAARDVK